MTHCDVLIVGGGPAGSACAWKLRDSGLEVRILEKKPFPRDKVCAGWITPAVVEELEIDLEEYRHSRVLEPIFGFCVGLLGGPEVETRHKEPISYGIRRCEFDHYLLERSGARLQLGEALQTMERLHGHWLVNGAIRAALVVGAGGHFCPVARFLGARPGSGERAVAAQEVEFAMSQAQLAECPVPAGLAYIYFCNDLQGYGWYYRKGNYLNVGLGREDDQQLSKHVEAFCSSLIAQGKIPRSTPRKFHGHAYLLYIHAPRRLIADGLLLIGDAAGLAYSRSGEGIRPAIESGLMAADVIRAAAGNYTSDKLHPYLDRLAARFGKKGGRSLSDFLPLALKQLVAARLMASPWFSRHIIVDRWFLHRNEPALAST